LYNTKYMDECSTPSLSLPLFTPGYPRRSGGVGGHFDEPMVPVHNVVMMVFLPHPPLLPAKECTLRPPCAEVAMARASSASVEKTRKPSNSVKLSQIEGPSKGHNSLEPCGEMGLNPCFRPMPPKAPFWAKKPMK